MDTASPKRLLNIRETAKYLGISERTIYNGTSKRSKTPFPVKSKRIGKSVRFDLKDLDEYIDSL